MEKDSRQPSKVAHVLRVILVIFGVFSTGANLVAAFAGQGFQIASTLFWVVIVCIALYFEYRNGKLYGPAPSKSRRTPVGQTKAMLAIGISLLVIVGVYLAVTIGYNIAKGEPKPQTQTVDATKTQEQSPPTVDELLKLVNQERAKVGVAPLTLDTRLNSSAQRKADDMTKYKYFSHVSPHDGKHGYEYINDVGIYCKTDSENIVEGLYDDSAKGLVDSWVASPAHYKAMVNPKYTLTGFGISGLYVVEHFCEQ